MVQRFNLAWAIACVGLMVASAAAAAAADGTQRQYLSGRGSDDAVAWEFYCTGGAKAGQWMTIPVPSCWDALGFGTLNYFRDGENAEQGKYRHRFAVPDDWRGQKIFLVFDGVLTDTQVWVNGKSAGEKHQGGFYRFSYDVSDLVTFGGEKENLLEVTVDKRSANASINRAERDGDYWMFGGIFRPVWLEARPAQHIERIAIDARADGTITIDAFGAAGLTSADRVEAQVMELDGTRIGPAMSATLSDGKARIAGKIAKPKTWTAETPNLYRVEVRLLDGDEVVHRMSERFGFRTIEIRKGDGFYVNGKRVLLKGANRHSFWPESGRATNEKLSRRDVQLMKEMNCNAVRMSHYPPDEHFLDACDELGLYVLDELAGWQKSYDTPTATRLVGQMIRRDVNHPSIILWDNGNEGGWNTDVDDEFANWDPQQRAVLHPWEAFGGINTKHYSTFEDHQKLCAGPDIYLPTEILHGLYDGGHGAGLADYWEALRASRVGGGMFLWAWVDEAVKRPDTGAMDTHGNNAPDGLMGPYREKEGSFYAVKEIWSPVIVRRRGDDGAIEVENRYDFTSTRDCTFTFQLRSFRGPFDEEAGHAVRSEWKQSIEVPAGGKKTVAVEMPKESGGADALALRVDDPSGRELWTWVWPLRRAVVAHGVPTGSSGEIPFPRAIEVAGGGELTKAEWRAGADGWVELEYAYTLEGDVDYHGISFDLPEEQIRSMRWLGQGPYRAWKNRLAGGTLGVWENAHNDTITGHARWQYPEFKGYYAGVRWMRLETDAGPLVIELADPSLYVQVGRPRFPGDPKPWSATTAATQRSVRFPKTETAYRTIAANAWAPFPDAGLSVLHAIPAMGNKFHLARETGPQGQQNVARGEYRGRVRFYFDGRRP